MTTSFTSLFLQCYVRVLAQFPRYGQDIAWHSWALSDTSTHFCRFEWHNKSNGDGRVREVAFELVHVGEKRYNRLHLQLVK